MSSKRPRSWKARINSTEKLGKPSYKPLGSRDRSKPPSISMDFSSQIDELLKKDGE